MHKSGSGYDLPIAVGIIAATEQMEFRGLGEFLIMGELGLDGSIRDVPGALPIADYALSAGFRGMILPVRSALEVIEFEGLDIYGVERLEDVLRILTDGAGDLLIQNSAAYSEALSEERDHSGGPAVDFEDIIGQEGAKRGMEIASAGAHNVLLLGPPGSGKSSLAKAVPGILPPFTKEEAITASKIWSVAGKKAAGYGLMRARPFRSPHNSSSIPAMIGGGSGDNIVPGEVSLAQGGVLFLDEFCEAPKKTLEALRGPMEDRCVVISRLKAKIRYPASFMLIAASNPCPCGYFGEADRCTCTPGQRAAYLSRLSGPITDRLDLQIWMHPVETGKLVGRVKGESSAAVAERVAAARRIQAERFAGEGIFTNSEMSNAHIERFCPLSEGCRKLMADLIEKMGLSARAYTRIIRIARTIADLEASPDILTRHLAEASLYRFLDRRDFYG